MEPRLRRGGGAAAVMLALALGGCTRSPATNPFAAPRGTTEQVRVTVENQNFGDATVHARRGGERIRLGMVSGKSEASFTVRWKYSLPMAFEINVVGGQECFVRGIHVDPGDRVWVRIPTEMSIQTCYSGKG